MQLSVACRATPRVRRAALAPGARGVLGLPSCRGCPPCRAGTADPSVLLSRAALRCAGSGPWSHPPHPTDTSAPRARIRAGLPRAALPCAPCPGPARASPAMPALCLAVLCCAPSGLGLFYWHRTPYLLRFCCARTHPGKNPAAPRTELLRAVPWLCQLQSAVLAGRLHRASGPGQCVPCLVVPCLVVPSWLALRPCRAPVRVPGALRAGPR